MVLMTSKKTPKIHKKRKKRQSNPTRMYFTADTESAIIEYNQSTDDIEKSDIFNTRIYMALDKLAENVINRFKFPYINESFEDVKTQVISFLVLILPKIKPEKGRAFSYLSVAAKHYLILHNNHGYRDTLRSTYLIDSSGEESILVENALISDPEPDMVKSDTRDLIRLLVRYWDFNLTRIFKQKRDQEVAMAIVEILRNSDTMEHFNKKALYVLIREMTDAKTNHITRTVNKMKSYVEEQTREYITTGHISDPSLLFTYDNEQLDLFINEG